MSDYKNPRVPRASMDYGPATPDYSHWNVRGNDQCDNPICEKCAAVYGHDSQRRHGHRAEAYKIAEMAAQRAEAHRVNPPITATELAQIGVGSASDQGAGGDFKGSEGVTLRVGDVVTITNDALRRLGKVDPIDAAYELSVGAYHEAIRISEILDEFQVFEECVKSAVIALLGITRSGDRDARVRVAHRELQMVVDALGQNDAATPKPE